MFLTKESLRKILRLVISYLALGTVSFVAFLFFAYLGEYSNLLGILGIVLYVLAGLFFLWGRYAEGKGKLINLGITLVRNQLKPKEFIEHYEFLKNSNNLVIKKPSIQVLQLVMSGYDSLADEENALATADEMLRITNGNDKKHTFAKIFKTSILFSCGKIQEAEQLFQELQKKKLDVMCADALDCVLKGDRAMAMGDYKTVEAFYEKLLERKFPKVDNLGKLIAHYQLGEVYEKLGETDKAMEHYRYCAEFGGETAIKTSAMEKLQYLKV